MKLFKKKKLSYEEIIRNKLKELEEARMTYFNKAQTEINNIVRGDVEAYHRLEYDISSMNQCTYEIQLLRDILEQARA